jgi:hypothetical protein
MERSAHADGGCHAMQGGASTEGLSHKDVNAQIDRSERPVGIVFARVGSKDGTD